jgi:hypothetical protein
MPRPQVLQEYCNVALKRLRLPAQHIRAQLDLYEHLVTVKHPDGDIPMPTLYSIERQAGWRK